MKHFFLSLMVFLFYSCVSSKNYTQEDCELLSMRAFKGLPKESKLFQDHCGDYVIKHDRAYCESVLKSLVLSGSKKAVTDQHGPEALECLTENDLKAFIKK